MKDIAKFSKVGYTTVKRLWKTHFKALVKQTRTVGKAKMYALDLENKAVQSFIDFYWAITDAEVNRYLNVKPKHTGSSPVSVSVSARGL